MDACCRFLTAIAVLLAASVSAGPAQAQKRLAFVVGTDTYDNLPPTQQLQKAVGDAEAMSNALTSLGFHAITVQNPTRSAFNARWQEFLNTVSAGDTVAFVFSGHGVEIGGTNFLLPRDVPAVRSGRDELLIRESLSLQEILADLRERQPRFSLVILDACRDNPFATLGERSVRRAGGLANVEPPEGTFIMYSAGAYQTALDRLSDNDLVATSVYTRNLIPLLKMRDLSLLQLADRVGVKVRDLAQTVSHRQTPTFYSGVVGAMNVCLTECTTPRAAEARLRYQPTSIEATQLCRDLASISSEPLLRLVANQNTGTPISTCSAKRLDQIKAESKALQAKIRQREGRINSANIVLEWQTQDDLDLQVLCPTGEKISFANRRACNAELDIDAGLTEPVPGTAIENIVLYAGAPPGRYTVIVNRYKVRPTRLDPTPFKVKLLMDGELVSIIDAEVSSGEKTVLNFAYPTDMFPVQGLR